MVSFKISMSKLSNVEMSDKGFCTNCKQEIVERCPCCLQFVYGVKDPEEVCEDCGQELPEEEEEVREEKYDKIRRKHGVQQPICNLCRRGMPQCPECKEDFEDYSDSHGYPKRDSDDDDDDDEEEDTEDEEEDEDK